VEELAAELGIEGTWERAEITNLGAEGTDESDPISDCLAARTEGRR
jgi:hypothetical protein